MTMWEIAADLRLGVERKARIPWEDQQRQRREAEEILRRLDGQPGVILADEVGMGKTFVALAVAASVARQARSGPVVLMVPPNLVDKWAQDLRSFFAFYIPDAMAIEKPIDGNWPPTGPRDLRFARARHSVELMRLLDDPPRERCHAVILAQRALSHRQSDKWVRFAFIAETLRRHARRQRLAKVRSTAHRFLGELLEALGEQSHHRDGEAIWLKLLKVSPENWRDVYNRGCKRADRMLYDDPVPKALIRLLPELDLVPLAEALEGLPIRIMGGRARERERVLEVRQAVREAESALWVDALARMRWRSPLLILDEAHHLKNSKTTLALTFQELDEQSSTTGHGAIFGRFDRMVFLTATPFQLGHRELVSVLDRFDGVRWDASAFGERSEFKSTLTELGNALDAAQRSSISLQRVWARLPSDLDVAGPDWESLLSAERDKMDPLVAGALNRFDGAAAARTEAQRLLAPWVIRHNKGLHWEGGTIVRRERRTGRQVLENGASGGLVVPGTQLLPFYLAARSTSDRRQDLLGEALASSYEAFRYTRRRGVTGREVEDEPAEAETTQDEGPPRWYLRRFDRALQDRDGSDHPKLSATVKRVVDLWEAGEKVLVFAFYVRTCRALRFHISCEIEKRLYADAARRLGLGPSVEAEAEVDRLIERIQDRYFDTIDAPGRRAVDEAMARILEGQGQIFGGSESAQAGLDKLRDVMRRFMRVTTTLIRYFPIDALDAVPPTEAIEMLLGNVDQSGLTWREKLEGFLRFLAEDCSPQERWDYLEATSRLQTGGIRHALEEADLADNRDRGRVLLPNVKVATGETSRDLRTRLMRGFNTPFFPDVLVSSEVMGEGVDLHRACRHVIHHDLDWNPSRIEQRTGRVDRLGCKAEGRHPINVYMPYIAGMTDERQFKVMTDREQWFRVVMGQDQVADLVQKEGPELLPLPESFAERLSFKLAI